MKFLSKKRSNLVFLTLLCAFFLSHAPSASAATTAKITPTVKLEVSGWIPYWRTATGTADVLPNLNKLTEVNPFGYTVKMDGTLYNALQIEKKEWQTLIKAAKAKKVRVIPTVMWSDTASIHAVLSDPALRSKHVKQIVDTVVSNNFDGIDIDYEGKLAEDKDNYSAFLKELSVAFGTKKANKWLMCTIEARMPLSARYSGAIPPGIEYANDLPMINKYCDRVRIMTYDQGTADVELNKAHKTEVYAPIADTAWVEKVVNYMAQDIERTKMVIGVATYGYDYQVMPNTSGSGYSYDLLEAFNPRYATDVAKEYGITPIRNSAGELSFSYIPKETSKSLPTQAQVSLSAPKGTVGANLAAAGALALVKSNNTQAPFHVLWWSDAGAIKSKVALAKKLGVKGIAIFKFDGGQDPAMWSVLP